MAHAVRVAIDGTIRDYEAFSSYAKRTVQFIQDNEPGTEAWEVFVDEASGEIWMHEIYATENAFITHVQSANDRGAMEEFLDLVTLHDVAVLGRIEDDRVREIVDQFNARTLHGLAGVARAHE